MYVIPFSKWTLDTLLPSFDDALLVLEQMILLKCGMKWMNEDTS